MAKKTSEETKRKTSLPRAKRGTGQHHNATVVKKATFGPAQLRRVDIPFDLPSDPPIFPPHTDAVEIHAWGHEVSIVFLKMPFQRETERTTKRTVMAVASVTMTSDFANDFYKLLGEQLKNAAIMRGEGEGK